MLSCDLVVFLSLSPIGLLSFGVCTSGKQIVIHVWLSSTMIELKIVSLYLDFICFLFCLHCFGLDTYITVWC